MKSLTTYFSAHPLVAGAIALGAVIVAWLILRVIFAIIREKKAAAEARRLRAEKAEKAENLSYFFTKK